MAWNPNKPKLEVTTVNTDARLKELAKISPKPQGFKDAPTSPNPVPASNFPANTVQDSPELANKLSSTSRATQQRRDDDNVKNQSIGLEDIDEAIVGYMQNDLNIFVTDNGQQVKVPVIYGSPERWKAALKDGFIRDKKGQIQLPIIMVRRTVVARNDQFMTFNRHLSETFVRKYSEKNRYDRFGLLNGASTPMVPVKEIYSVTLPDQVLITYECLAWTDYVQQMNRIIERVNFAAEEYWGDPNRFKFRVRISEYSNTTEVEADDDRLIRSSFNLEVWGYLLPETFQNNKATVQKSLTPRKIVLGVETQIGQREFMNLKPRQTSALPNVSTQTADTVKKTLYEYIGSQKTIYGGMFVTNNAIVTTIKFENTKLTETPLALINSIKDSNKFTLFIDGVVIPKSAVATFLEVGNDFVITLTNANLPFPIDSSTEIYSIGKFE